MIDAARSYLRLGLVPIPVGADKNPLVKWEPFQTEAPHADQVDEWWTRWPEVGVGTVTGAISGLVVLDADGPEGRASLRKRGPDARRFYPAPGRGEPLRGLDGPRGGDAAAGRGAG